MNNINEDNGDKDFVRVRVSEQDSPNYHYLYAMVDSGNRACSLMSQKAFKKIYKNQSLSPVPQASRNLNGAGDGHALIPIGRPKVGLYLWFYSPDPKEKRTLRVKMHPLVVKNLHLPFLLSYKDLKALGATVHFKTDILELPYMNDERPISIHMRSNLIQCTPVLSHSGINIEPGQEVVFPAEVLNSQIHAEVLIEPEEAFINKTCLKMVTVVDKVRHRNEVTVRVWNPTSHIVTVKPNTVVATAIPFNEEPQPDVAACLSMNTMTETDELMTNEEHLELAKRLYVDLFHEKDTTLTDEQKYQVIMKFIKWRKALALNPEDVGLVKDIQFGIDTGDHPPVSCKSRPLPPHLLNDLKTQIKKWLSQGVAEPCNGPWASALVHFSLKD